MPVVIAFDTNLLVRALVADNDERVAVVRQLITQDTVFLSRTVLLESEWVLRSRYGTNRAELGAFLRHCWKRATRLSKVPKLFRTRWTGTPKAPILPTHSISLCVTPRSCTPSTGVAARPPETLVLPRKFGCGRFEGVCEFRCRLPLGRDLLIRKRGSISAGRRVLDRD
jgi:hypothetical protein